MNDVTSAILERLYRAETRLSGEQLCREFGMSRSAIWKHIRQLRKSGCRIDAVTGSGYRLKTISGTPVAREVALFLETRSFGRTLHYLHQTDSTNLSARKLALEGVSEGTVVIADSQRSGRGRFGRPWVSPPGSNLYCSLILRPPVISSRVPQITMLAALAIFRALHEASPETEMGIKWPNDILVDTKKLCGVLSEMQSDSDMTHFVVVGIGININQEVFSEELRGKATSLFLETGSRFCRPKLLAGVLNRFEELYVEWLREDDLGFIQQEIEHHSLLQGKPVTIDRVSGRLEGVVTGIAPGGELLLRSGEGKVHTVSSGEATLRQDHCSLKSDSDL